MNINDYTTKNEGKYNDKTITYRTFNSKMTNEFLLIQKETNANLEYALYQLKNAKENNRAINIDTPLKNNVNGIEQICEELEREIESIKKDLETLYKEFDRLIYNVNVEITKNFGTPAYSKTLHYRT